MGGDSKARRQRTVCSLAADEALLHVVACALGVLAPEMRAGVGTVAAVAESWLRRWVLGNRCGVLL